MIKKKTNGASWGKKRGGGIQLYGDSSYATFFLGSLLIQRGFLLECQDSRVLNVETQVITWGDPTAGGDSSQAGSRLES